jgi:hypothetical protein
MATIPPASPGSAAPPASVANLKSSKQAALEEALAVVKSVAAGNAGGAITKQIRDQRAAAAQENLGRAQERYRLLRETMFKVLAAGGDPRSVVRLAREAATMARDVAKAVKDIATAVKDGDPATADSRRATLDGLRKESHKLLYGIRSLVDAARIVNTAGEDGLPQSRRAKEIDRARRETEEALTSVTREIAGARTAIRGGGVALDA